MDSKFVFCPGYDTFMGSFDEETNAYHWIMKSGMTHISRAIPFSSREEFERAINSLRLTETDINRVLKFFDQYQEINGFNYCLDNALDRIRGIAKSGKPIKPDLTQEEKCEMYVCFKFLPDYMKSSDDEEK